jgi:NAD(P)-dependent dehydrogenase (short-subunit alcohol dehydrogenase family)
MASAAVLDDMSEALLADVVQRQLIKRRGEIQDLVGALLYLCSDDASFVTGETIRVSGGYPLTL